MYLLKEHCHQLEINKEESNCNQKHMAQYFISKENLNMCHLNSYLKLDVVCKISGFCAEIISSKATGE